MNSAAAFLAQVPVNQLEVVIKQYIDILGLYQRAEGTAPNFKLIFSKGTVATQIVLDAEGRIAGFWLGQPVPLIGGIEEAYTLLNKPFLTTREAFALKNSENGALLDAYRQGDEQAKLEVLDQIQNAPLPDVSLFIGGPVAMMKLANLMAYVQDLPLM